MIHTLFIFHEWVLLILRLGIGLIFLIHGFSRVKNVRENTKHFDAMGFCPGVLWGTTVGILELIGGLFIIIGLFTTSVSVLLALEVIVILAWKLKRRMKFAGGYEFDLLLLIALLVLATTGNAIFSIDEYLFYLFF